MSEALAQFHDLVASARNIVAFTGAGISTECGIPDFRSPDSAWKRHAPIPFKDFLASEDQRIESWVRKFAMDDLYADAQPGRGHRALSAWETSGKLISIITQNIDGLHQASGVPAHKVIELHGNGTYATCLSCHARHELSTVRPLVEARQAPQCHCGGIVKSATISFRQSMPKEAMQRARDMCRQADLFVAIGSSLVVYPAAAFPVFAKECGADLVIINGESTPLDSHADLCLRGDIGDILAPFCTG